jgi:hypothetical protein
MQGYTAPFVSEIRRRLQSGCLPRSESIAATCTVLFRLDIPTAGASGRSNEI